MVTQFVEDLPDPGDRQVPRYSAQPLPAYRYVPGVHPHPLRDPSGHSYEVVRAARSHTPWSPESWRQLEDWLYGIDLFNWFYFWEAHEAWEELWASAPTETPQAQLLQGLIQIAAALLKTHMRVPAGARRLSAQGMQKLQCAAAVQHALLGLDLDDVVQSFTAYFAPLEEDRLPVLDARVPVLRVTL